jgi:hypothetical protein
MSDAAPAAACEVSVVIVNWNARQALLDCLASLEASPPAPAWEAIVVDNGSYDGSTAAVSTAYPWVRLVANAGNRGLPAANNQGMALATGSALLICNPDVVFQTGAAAAMVDVLDRRPTAGMVIPRLRYPDGGVQTSAGDLPTLGAALRGRQAQRHEAAAGATTGFWWDGWAHDEERPIGRGHEAAYVVRRTAVDAVGPQDEGFRLDWEGIDWTARFRDAGWEVWFCPAADVIHLGGTSIRQVPFRWVISSHRGMYRYFAKRRPAAWRPALAVVIGARAAVKLGATAAGVAMYERAHRGGGGRR